MSKNTNKKGSFWLDVDRPLAKITASVSLVGTLAASFVMFYQGVNIPEAGYTLIGSIVAGAVMFLFKKDDVS